MSLKKFLFKFSLILIVFSTFAGKSFSLEPKEFVQSVANEASLILAKNFTKEQKIEKLKSIAEETVDIQGIGYYSLGAHRKNLSDDKKKEYLDIFKEYFLKSFSSRLSEYTDPKIHVDSQKKLNEKYFPVNAEKTIKIKENLNKFFFKLILYISYEFNRILFLPSHRHP